MRIVLTLLFLFNLVAAEAQVRYVVVCNTTTQKIEILKNIELAEMSDMTRLSPQDFPTRATAGSWKRDNFASDNCGSGVKIQPPAPPVTPPPAKPEEQNVVPPPEKKITHINNYKVSLFGSVLFDTGDWLTPVSGGKDFIPFSAGISYRNGNKAKFGFEAAFQGWGKEMVAGEAKILATATLSFVFAYPVAVDKEGRFWVVPEAGIGVDFFDVFQTGEDFIPEYDQKIAAPSFFLRVGIEMYHVKPFFYYGRTMIDVSDGFTRLNKPNHIGTGLAVLF